MKLIDFSKSKLSNIYYGGSEKKLGIIYNNERYMLKFQKNTPISRRNNTISEYIGSHIYNLIGIKSHETILGIYKNENVVACKDFITDEYQFVAFNDVGESSIDVDKEKYQYSYEDIMELLKSNKKITDLDESISFFFEMYIVDALIGNFDRHGANWGFLKKDNKYYISPVFDNGSCLYPSLTDEEEMLKIISNEDEIDLRIYKFPTSQIKLNGTKSSYYEVISSLQYEEINKALQKIYPLINLEEIFALIDDIPIISDIHKRFYKTMIEKRYDKIIKTSYNKLMAGDKK